MTESKINNTVADSITLTFLTLPLYFYCSGADASQGPCPDGVARSVPRAEWNQRVALRRSGAVVQPCWGIYSDCLIIMREGGLIQLGHLGDLRFPVLWFPQRLELIDAIVPGTVPWDQVDFEVRGPDGSVNAQGFLENINVAIVTMREKLHCMLVFFDAFDCDRL